MANTITNLMPDIYAALDVVSRELVGFIPSVARDARTDRAALNQNVRVPITPAGSASATMTPAMAFPSAQYQTIANSAVVITKSNYVGFSWDGDQIAQVNEGPGFLTLRQDQIAQALRTLTNEIELDLANAAVAAASRAYGTAASTPFASTLADSAQILKILSDNGAPPSNRKLVINTTTGANLRALGQLTKANEAADTTMLRQGLLMMVHGFDIRESAQLSSHTAGTASGATTDSTGYAIGTTTITLASAGTGTLVAGDVVVFQGDTNKYVITSGDTNVSDGGTITIAAPGLRTTMAASTRTITVTATYSNAGVGFTQNALVLAQRLPSIPPEGDLATDRATVTDPRSGLSFEFAVYPGFRMNTYTVSSAWGVKAIKPEHIALLVG